MKGRRRSSGRKRTLGAPPLLVSEEQERQFQETDATFQRLWVQVANNPSFKDTADCNKAQVGQTYRDEWQPYASTWKADSFLDRADESKLNELTGRANGWARACFPDYKPVQGTDVEVAHSTAAWVDLNMPGGTPPRDGGILGFKKSSLIVGGVLLLATATALRVFLPR